MPTLDDARLDLLIMLVHLVQRDVELLQRLLELRLAQELEHAEVVRPTARPGLRRRRAHVASQ